MNEIIYIVLFLSFKIMLIDVRYDLNTIEFLNCSFNYQS